MWLAQVILYRQHAIFVAARELQMCAPAPALLLPTADDTAPARDADALEFNVHKRSWFGIKEAWHSPAQIDVLADASALHHRRHTAWPSSRAKSGWRCTHSTRPQQRRCQGRTSAARCALRLPADTPADAVWCRQVSLTVEALRFALVRAQRPLLTVGLSGVRRLPPAPCRLRRDPARVPGGRVAGGAALGAEGRGPRW